MKDNTTKFINMNWADYSNTEEEGSGNNSRSPSRSVSQSDKKQTSVKNTDVSREDNSFAPQKRDTGMHGLFIS